MVLIVVLPRRLQILPRQAGDGVEHFSIRRPQIPSLHESPHCDARVANTGIAAAHARRFGDPARGLRRIERSGARVGILGSHGCSFLLLRHYTSPAGSGADSRPIKLPGQTVFLCLLNALVNHPVVSQRLLKATYEKVTGQTVDHSSFSKRLATVNPDYFEALYQHVYQKIQPLMAAHDERGLRLRRVDATTVVLSA